MNELMEFLYQNRACAGGIGRLENLGAETLEDAWKWASPADLVWAVTRPGVMSPEQRRQFLVFVLESIEDKLTDARSKNILEKLRTKSPITEDAARKADAAWAYAASDAAYAASPDAAYAAARAARAAAWAADAALAAYDAVWSAAEDAAEAWAEAARKARATAWAAAAAARKAAREQQARWIRKNFALSDLHIN